MPKYHNKKVRIGGKLIDSKREAKRYQELLLLERAGRISELQTQVKFVLIPEQREPSTEVYSKGAHKGEPKPGMLLERETSYYADFVYWQDGHKIVEDAKGVRTKEYIIKRKLMLERHGIRIREV